MRVLLAEDNAALRDLFGRVLRRLGCDVREAEDAFAVLEVVEAFAPELVMTDLMMPGMDGVELIARLRAMPVMEGVPIVAVTADATPEAERRAREAGASEVAVKPVYMADLLARVRAYRKTDEVG